MTTVGMVTQDVLELRQKASVKKMASRKTEVYEVEALQFSILSTEDILKLSELKICNKELYCPMTQSPMPFGVLDERLGATKDKGLCKTCGRTFHECSGHWGHITLHHPVLHIGYFKHLINLLYCICKICSRLLLSDEDKRIFLAKSRRCHDAIQRRALLKTLVNKCKREAYCLSPQCRAPQGILRRVMKPSLDQFMKIVLQKKIRREGMGSVASRTSIVNEDLDPNYIRQLLRRISAVDCSILDVHLPEKLIISSVLVPPKCIRPSVTLGDAGTNEDDLTIVFSEIVDTNNILKAQCLAGVNSPSILGNWELLQLQCTRFINSEALAVQPLLASKNISFNGRGICQRLKGKEGRFRGNLSGKRVDFSGRTVISPDANCPISDVVVPMWSAKRLTFPEHVCEATIEKLRKAVLNGADDWPGALFVIKKDGGKTSLRFANRRHVAENLQYGDIVERHLRDGDIVLFNRQPSLHRVSIMAHRARVMPWKTFRFNECVCTPYNADFDGDEMNCHLPQTQEARAEALYLMGVVNNLVTPKNGEPLIAATQDFLSGAYLLTNKDTFITRETFCQYCCYFTDGKVHIDLPPPAILKPMELWTGKQLLSTLLRPNRYSINVIVNLEVREREFSRPQDSLPDFMCPRDGYVVFDNSELVCGAVAKMTLGNGSKNGMIYHLIRDNTPRVAAACLGRLAKLIGRWFSNHGMTIGIDDVTPTENVSRQKTILLDKGYQDIEQEITLYKKKQLQPNPGCTVEETLEIRVKSILDELRSLAGKMANDELPSTNKPLIMFLSGAKGALINVAQMIALVGQQNVSGQRIQNGFVERTLPHFDNRCQSARARGFVAHSFYDGLDPDEFFFHTMSGREGLVDTAVKTAETGYMQRRLVKALEDLSVCYDRTVRTSDGQIVQFVYGDDGLNPTSMENKKSFFSLQRVYQNVSSMISISSMEDLTEMLSKQDASISHKSLPDGKNLEIDEEHRSSNEFSNSSVHGVLDSTLLPFTVLPPDPSDSKAAQAIKNFVQRHLNEARHQLAQRLTRRQQNSCVGDFLSKGYDGARKPMPSEKKRPCTTDLVDDQMRMKDLGRISEFDTVLESSKKLRESHNVMASSSSLKSFCNMPRLLQEKLIVMESWRVSSCFQSEDPNTSFSLNHDPCYIQTQNNVLAHVTVHEWLHPAKLHVPLLPFEILHWGRYLLKRTAEPLPSPLCEHQKISLDETSTHQALTTTVKTFEQELLQWIHSKVHDVTQYRVENGIEPANTLESYCKALECLRSLPDCSTGSGEENHSTRVCIPCGEKNMKIFTSRFACSNYPRHPLLRRMWIVQCNSTTPLDSTAFSSKKEEKEEDQLKAHQQHVVDNTKSLDSKARRWKYNKNYWVTPRHLLEFFRLAWRKYNRALTEPGEAVGAIGAQSIGEPGTQMTLKTFHFAGVASMNVTLGVPRIKEILNASTKIATPIIQVTLENPNSFDYALMVKSRMEKTLLGSVCLSLKQVFSPEGAYLAVKLDLNTISRNFLPITAESVQKSILATPGLLGPRLQLKTESVVIVSSCKLHVHPPVTQNLFFDLQVLKQKIQSVRLAGLEHIKRGVIKQEEIKDSCEASAKKYHYSLAVEGYGLREVMGTAGVLGTQCTSNHVMEVKQILGIEAARFVIIDEIRNCMEAYSMDIDCRHMQLLGDVMTFRGDVLGISRFGIQKTRASTLMLASFEETNEHLFEAAAHNREDKIRGVSECIIMGKPISLGTGAFDLLYDYKHHWKGEKSAALLGYSPCSPTQTVPTVTRASLLLSKYASLNTQAALKVN